MGTMERIRKMSPLLMGFIAFMFIGFMIIADTDLGTIISQDGMTGSQIAEVNGEKIDYSQYEERVRRQIEQRREQLASQNQGQDVEVDDDPIRESVFNQMVDEVLLQQRAEALGISVTDEEVRDVLIESPPDFIRQQFSDQSGTFMRDAYLQILSDPDGYFQRIWESYPDSLRSFDPKREAARFKESMIDIEQFIRLSRLEQKIQSVVTSSLGIPSLSVMEYNYNNQNTETIVDVVSVDISAIPDSAVSVSDADINAFYNANKAAFKQKSGRRIQYVVFPLVPSDKDSARVQKRMRDFQNALASAPSDRAKDSVFTLAMAEANGRTSDYMRPNDVDPSVLSIIAGQPKGSIVGPIQVQGAPTFYRVDDLRSGENEVVKASHILFRVEADSPDSADARQKALDALRRAKAGEDFEKLARELSEDPSATSNGGDLGFFGRGMMVPEFEEAAFAAQVGSIVGPVRSQFGYHVISVTDKESQEIKYSSMSFRSTISNATRRQLRVQADEIKASVAKGKTMEDAAAELGVQMQSSGFFDQSTPVLGSRTLTNSVFGAKVNEVLNVIEVRGFGLVLARVTDVRVDGTQPLADVKEEITSKVLRQKKLDAVKEKAEELHKKLAGASSFAAVDVPQAANINKRLDVAVRNNGFVPGLGQDFIFTGSVTGAAEGKVHGPIRGEQAYHIFLVKSRTKPQEGGFAAQQDGLMQQAKSQAASSTFPRWKRSLRSNATIKDFRR